ncbi:cytochrome P450 [Ustulina deusta]|nr:cytochrome P450 [Ustulina deusta]
MLRQTERTMASNIGSQLVVSLLISLTLAVVSSFIIARFQSRLKFPIVNVKRGEWTWRNARKRFQTNAAEVLQEGQRLTDGPFHVVTDTRGVMTYLPPHYAEYIKNDNRFSFAEFAHRDMMGYLPGFEAFGSILKSGIAIDAVQKKISPNMEKLTAPISNTMAEAARKNWGEDSKFHEIELKKTVLFMVAQVTARLFVGPELSNNPDWLRLSVTYTVDTFLASKELGRYSWPLTWIAQWFNVRAGRVRASMREACQIIGPIIAKRARDEATDNEKGGRADAISWYRQVAKGREYDEAIAQVGLALAAIHTTGDLLFRTLLRLADHPQLMTELRKEAAQAITTHGLNKTGVYHMQLLDSAIKESQRLDTVAPAIMNRYVKEDATLPNGVTIPKGYLTTIITDIMQSEKTYKDAKKWDPYRFYNLRQNGYEQKGQLVSATAEHLAFGFGKHACPGRFLAAHELKIILAHLVLKYDIEFKKGATRADASANVPAGDTRVVQVRRRKEEIEIPTLPEV